MRRPQPVARYGNKVQILVTGRLDDGQVFENTPNNQPLEFTLGKKEVIQGLEVAVEGMRLGEAKQVLLTPESGFGIRKEEYVQVIPRTSIPKEFVLEKGKVIAMQRENGIAFQAVVKDFNQETVTLDFNHPLAGKRLSFDIKLVGIQ
ncbi:FKBP-type peptidyl-prolyl cis-trans isomerase [Candidatus Woesearchaeota archaeon]|nr:FKBP-type peptidyl-prolyl cis-trans isomerase [Candidatus Woesearchaeota archaeon]